MDMSETQEKANEGGTPQTETENDDTTAACSKQQSSDESSATQRPRDQAQPRDQLSPREQVREAFIRGLLALNPVEFQAAVENFVNFYVETEHLNEFQVMVLSNALHKIYTIVRSTDAGATVEGQEPQEPRF